MHATKTNKLALENMKKEAQEEAPQRATRAKARWHQILAMDTISTDKADYVLPMLLQVGIAQAKTTCNGILDSGGAVNVMAEHIYKEFINKSLTSTTNKLNSVSNQPINCKGMVTASVNVGAHK